MNSFSVKLLEGRGARGCQSQAVWDRLLSRALGSGWPELLWGGCYGRGGMDGCRMGHLSCQCCYYACYPFLQATVNRNPRFLFLRASPSTQAPTRRMPRVMVVAALQPSPREIPRKVQPPRPSLSLPVCPAAVPGCVSVPSSAQFRVCSGGALVCLAW